MEISKYAQTKIYLPLSSGFKISSVLETDYMANVQLMLMSQHIYFLSGNMLIPYLSLICNIT